MGISGHIPASAVSAGHPLTAQAAAHILMQGGNAYDAILAAMFMSFVTEPLLSSPGGGGFLLAAPNNQAIKLVDFFSNTPLSLPGSDMDFCPIYGDFGETRQEFYIGHAASAIPGVPAGIHAIHSNYCTLPLINLAEMAIKQAGEGIRVNRQQALVRKILEPIIRADKAVMALYGNMKTDAIWKAPALADFIKTLCREKSDWFYQSEPMLKICELHKQNKGLLTEIDFTSYQPVTRDPLHVLFDDYEVITNPKPSSGGGLIIKQLQHSLNEKPLPCSEQEIKNCLQAMKLINRQIQIENEQIISRGTTHISVSDKEGNLASLTLSNGEGNGRLISEYGFMLNNFLGEYDINPGGYMRWQTGQRLTSMMSPTVIIGNGRKIALGTGGSNRIKSTLFLVLRRLIKGHSLSQAIEAPRFHYERDHCDIEPGFSEKEEKIFSEYTPLQTLWNHKHLYFGGVNAVQTGETVMACGDSRRDGCGMIVSAM